MTKVIFVVIGYKKARTFSNIGLYRESSDEMWLMNMVEETFSYLNITKINSAEVQNNGECAFACLNEPMCFSYNLEARASKTGTRVCELLPSDKYNNSDEVIISQKFHHYSIQTPCSREPCQNYGTCVPRYEKNSYVCVCKIGFEGKDCETGEALKCVTSKCSYHVFTIPSALHYIPLTQDRCFGHKVSAEKQCENVGNYHENMRGQKCQFLE
ncbi:hypothetical protein pdam_00023257 [Pocillopora damicornis]|uniref:EGF-like domain-containing protein n=1 Tax=Pocillopora damicornis TaxID=46731 RepID=A0A3M6UL06_POCDA|nr:hypothetical protein pdam_00023257 [Pocillopora damicornis]